MLNFHTDEEKDIIENFKSKGFIRVKHSGKLLNEILTRLSINSKDAQSIHLNAKNVNEQRLQYIKILNSDFKIHQEFYKEFSMVLNTLLGNELCMQKNINLSIHTPNNDNDFLEIHTDSLCGNSFFELVIWTPITEAYDSNSMYILPIDKSIEALKGLQRGQYGHINDIKEEYEDSFEFLNVKPGESIIFSHNLLHGNCENITDKSRVSLNMRFKSQLTPFNVKKMGEYYLPITSKPVTQIGQLFDEIC